MKEKERRVPGCRLEVNNRGRETTWTGAEEEPETRHEAQSTATVVMPGLRAAPPVGRSEYCMQLALSSVTRCAVVARGQHVALGATERWTTAVLGSRSSGGLGILKPR